MKTPTQFFAMDFVPNHAQVRSDDFPGGAGTEPVGMVPGNVVSGVTPNTGDTRYEMTPNVAVLHVQHSFGGAPYIGPDIVGKIAGAILHLSSGMANRNPPVTPDVLGQVIAGGRDALACNVSSVAGGAPAQTPHGVDPASKNNGRG